jgi:alpha-N-arabinofuranosidase
MKRLPAGAIRWPGGCFADSYDWRDGGRPGASRPRPLFWVNDMTKLPDGPGKYDTNNSGRTLHQVLPAGRRTTYLAANLRKPACA